MSYTIKQAINSAVSIAEDLEQRGLLFTEMPDEEEGIDDADTLESIASLVLCDPIEGIDSVDAEQSVLTALKSSFPNYAN